MPRWVAGGKPIPLWSIYKYLCSFSSALISTWYSDKFLNRCLNTFHHLEKMEAGFRYKLVLWPTQLRFSDYDFGYFSVLLLPAVVSPHLQGAKVPSSIVALPLLSPGSCLLFSHSICLHVRAPKTSHSARNLAAKNRWEFELSMLVICGDLLQWKLGWAMHLVTALLLTLTF